MILDRNTGAISLPPSREAAHYHLMIDPNGTGLHHARLSPLSLSEHEHDTVQVSVLLDGLAAVTRTAGGSGGGLRPRERRIGAGCAYIVPPGQPHSFTADSSGAIVNLYLAPAFFKESLAGVRPDLGDLIVTDDPLIRHLAASLQHDFALRGNSDRLFVESAINVLAGHIAERFALNGLPAARGFGTLPMSRLKAVLEFVDQYHGEDITIAQMARVAGYSAVHFTRLFREATGYSPRRYLIQRRLAHARALLKSTDAPVIDVALRVGFNSHAHFTTQFRQLLGITPQQYRRANRH